MRFTEQKGVEAVELAIVLPILIILILGIVEFSLLLYNKQVITNASREGARAGIIQQLPRVTSAAIQTVVNQYALNHLITFGGSTTPTAATTAPCAGFGYDLTVTVTFQYHYFALYNFIPGLGEQTNLQAQTVMKCE